MLNQHPDFFSFLFFFFLCRNPGNSRILTFEIILRKVFWVGGRLTRKGIYVYLQLIYDVIQQKTTQHCKAIIFQFKKKFRLRNSRNRKNRRSLSADKKCINRNLSFILVLLSLCIFEMFDPYSI